MGIDEEKVGTGRRIRLLSYNIQVAIASTKPLHYLTRSWRHVFPHEYHFRNLNQIAEVIQDYDIVGLQEVDAGSIRSSYVNQTEYLAEKGGFPYWTHQTNRRLGHIAQHSNGLVSNFTPIDVENHRLPGRVPGRGALVARFGTEQSQLIVVMIHLALGKKARGVQLDYIAGLVKENEHVVVMGDMNCQPDSDELLSLLDKTGLGEPVKDLHTYPSWKPKRKLDHILVSPSLSVENVKVLPYTYSDHLPISMEVVLPASVELVA